MSHRTRALLRASLLVPAVLLVAACGSAPTEPTALSKPNTARLDEYTGRPCSDFDEIPEGYVCRNGMINPHG